MNSEDDIFDPPKRLAVAYAKGNSKQLFELLLKFDVRLGRIVQRSNEAIVGQMRMAWWRDVIAKQAAMRPSGEPLVAEISAVETQSDGEDISRALTQIVDAWDLLLANEDWTSDVKLEHSRLRSNAVFSLFAENNGPQRPKDVEFCGQQWALYDLANLTGADISDALEALPLSRTKLPRKHRPLSLLLLAARQQYSPSGRLAGLRLAWHGLTGL